MPTPADEQDLASIANELAQLSQWTEHPDGKEPPEAVRADAVDWKTNGWLATLEQVSSWLALPNEELRGLGALEKARDLFAQLGERDPAECVMQVDAAVLLTNLGASRLDAFLEGANSAKEQFEADIEDGMSRAEASRAWRSHCEDLLEATSHRPVKVNASVDTYKIKEFADYAAEGELELNPSYQRDVVWQNKDSQKLIESILRGIPLPSIILYRRKDSNKIEIVDGKQRLTAILRFMGAHPTGRAHANSVSTPEASIEMFKDNYRTWAKKHGIKPDTAREHFLPFPLARFESGDPLEPLAGKYYSEILSQQVQVQGKTHRIKDLFESATSKYLLPIILYEDTDLQQIHSVFGLYNSQGKKLNQEELRNAKYHHLGLARMLLALSGDGKDVDSLAPVLSGVNLGPVKDALDAMSVSRGRFHATKLASWVSALMVQAPSSSATMPVTPSTGQFINKMLDSLDEAPGHWLRRDQSLRRLGDDMIKGAALVSSLRLQEAFDERFSGGNARQARWEDLPVVGAWLACTLAGLRIDPGAVSAELADAVAAATRQIAPLDKQQSKSQWQWIARSVLALTKAMGLDGPDFEREVQQRYGYNCLETFRKLGT